MAPALAQVRRYDCALPQELIDALDDLAARAATERGTFWRPLEDSSSLIARTAACLVTLVPGSEGFTGVEWWVRSRPAATSMHLHFDRDESLARSTGKMKHPPFSSVLYLDDAGGPTLVLDQTICVDGTSLSPTDPESCILSAPKRNSFLIFPGYLRHGVIANPRLIDGNIPPRRTLLLNWWNERPTGPSCAAPPQHLEQTHAPVLRNHRPRLVTLPILPAADLYNHQGPRPDLT